MGFKDVIFSAKFGTKFEKKKLEKNVEKNFWQKNIYNKINQCDIIFALLFSKFHLVHIILRVGSIPTLHFKTFEQFSGQRLD